ncbi:MAG: SPOR domain-containing protein [Rhodospirillales bacterium]|nr:SPOR domain-containing protein [Rhodospirillales bacterium]
MTARTIFGFRRGAVAALLLAALLGGCATSGQGSVADGAPTPDGLVRMGDKARDRGELAVAAALYRKAHDADPERVRPLVSLGQVLMEMRRPDQAAEAFSAALVVDGRNLDALRGLGNAKLALHQPEQAVPPLQQALGISANDFRVLNALGVAFDMSGDHRGAHQYYRTGLKLAPDNVPLRSNYALSLALAGESEDALETMAPLASTPVTTPQQRQTMALVYGLAGNTTEAERLARMDLDETTVQANLQRIATLRQELALAPAEPDANSTPQPETTAAVLSEPLQPSAPKIEPVALKVESPPQRPQPQPSAAAPTKIAPPPTEPSAPPPPPAQQQAALSPITTDASTEAVAAEAEAKAATAPAITSGEVWLVQLASYLKPEHAEQGWRELSATAPELLAERQYRVEEGRLDDNTTVWRLRAGPYSAFSEAEGLCEQLKTRGLNCFVARSGS